MDAWRVGSDGVQPDRVVNGALIESLVVDLGTDRVRALVDLFVGDAPARIAALRAAVEAGDAGQAAKVAHVMKSAAGAVGALAFAARCGSVEQLAVDRHLDQARSDLASLPADLERAAEALTSALAAGTATADR